MVNTFLDACFCHWLDSLALSLFTKYNINSTQLTQTLFDQWPISYCKSPRKIHKFGIKHSGFVLSLWMVQSNSLSMCVRRTFAVCWGMDGTRKHLRFECERLTLWNTYTTIYTFEESFLLRSMYTRVYASVYDTKLLARECRPQRWIQFELHATLNSMYSIMPHIHTDARGRPRHTHTHTSATKHTQLDFFHIIRDPMRIFDMLFPIYALLLIVAVTV